MSYGDTGGAGGPELDFTVLPAGKTARASFTALAADKILWPRGGVLLGWSIREPAGSAAVLELHDGGDATGELMGAIPLAASGGSTIWFGPQGVPIRTSVFGHVVSGQVTGVLWIRTPSSVTE